MATKTAQEKIAEIRANAAAEIARLMEEALAELHDKRKAAEATLQGINEAIEELTGKPARSKRGGGASKGLPDVPSAAALKSLINKAEGKKLTRKGINAAGYSLKSALELAKGDKETFGFKQNKAQGEVWLK